MRGRLSPPSSSSASTRASARSTPTGRRPRRRARHDPRHRRRERRRQVDADDHPLRLLRGRCRRDPGRRPAGARSARPQDAITAGIGMVHQHFMLVEPLHRAGERDARRRGRPAPAPAATAQARAELAAARAATTGSRSIPTRRSATCRSACSSGSRSSRRCSAAPTS